MDDVLVAQERTSMGAPPPRRRHGGHHHRPRHGGGWRGPLWPREIYVAPYPAELYYGSTEEEVATYVQANECITLRRQGGPDLIRGEVVRALKARGWEERVDVVPAGGFNAKIYKLCPPAAESRVAVKGLGRIVLGQGPPRLRVVVSDRRGEPAKGISVVVLSPDNIGEGITDDDGVVLVNIPGGRTEAVIIATLPEGEMRQRVLLDHLGMQTVTFRSVRKVSGPILTMMEGASGVTGITLILIGALIDGTAGVILEGVGGSITIAAAYSTISRHV